MTEPTEKAILPTGSPAGTTTYALCLLDVLGFESLFRARGLSATQVMYERLVEFVQQQTGGMDVVSVGGFAAVGWLDIGQAYFSDTILFWINYDDLRFNRFCELCCEAVCVSIELGMPVRGAVTVGEAVLDKSKGIYLGAPLIEAARVEAAQRWIGISVGPSATSPPYSQSLFLHLFLPYKSHVKEGSEHLVPGLVLDWPRKWRESRADDLDAKVRALDTDPRFSTYYQTTLRFIDFSIRNHDWFAKTPRLGFG